MRLQLILVQVLFLLLLESSNGFSFYSFSASSSSSSTRSKQGMVQRSPSLLKAEAAEDKEKEDREESRERITAILNSPSTPLRRRLAVQTMVLGAAVTGMSLVSLPQQASSSPSSADDEQRSMYEPKFVQQYDDFALTPEGWSFRDVKVGQGESPQLGDRVVFDWSGYTIGYFGRPFQAKG
jgi:FKBP-type peptidyl-prolyl cis-trans isomerase